MSPVTHNRSATKADFHGAEISVHVDLSSAGHLAVQGQRTIYTPAGEQNDIENVLGSPVDDTIVGNGADNELKGSNDYGSSVDETESEQDADSIDAKSGNDTLDGNGPDHLVGGPGDDTFNTVEQPGVFIAIDGGAGHNAQVANFNNYTLPSFTLAPTISDLTADNSEGLGRLIGNALDNRIDVDLRRNGDDDTAFYESRGVGMVSGGAGNDTIVAEAIDERFVGGKSQTFEGNAGNDLLIGAADDDAYADDVYLRGGAGRDTLESAGGSVWADYSDQTTPITVDLSTHGYRGPNSDVDTLIATRPSTPGGAGKDVIAGLGGNDAIDGMGGDDTLSGGLSGGGVSQYYGVLADQVVQLEQQLATSGGRDTLSDGGGNDAADYTVRKNDLSLSLDGKADDGASGEKDAIDSDIETLLGGQGNDHLSGNAADNTFFGGPHWRPMPSPFPRGKAQNPQPCRFQRRWSAV